MKSVVAVENTRKAAVASSAQHHELRELYRRFVNSARSGALREAGTWEAVVERGAQWALETSDTFDVPPAWMSQPWPPTNIGKQFERAAAMPEDVRQRRREAQNAELLAVRARNRSDDWQHLLRQAAAD